MPCARLFLRIALAAVASFLMPTPPARAVYCTSGTELTQDFPSSGPAVSQWHLCWEILRMPDGVGAQRASCTPVCFASRKSLRWTRN